MSEETGASAGSEAVPLPAAAPETFNSPSDAASFLAKWREDRENPSAESADPATAEHELAVEANPESPAKETTEGDNEDEPAKPAIDPPKSWTKDLHEHWANLDPVLQERIVARDREDQAAIKRAFNDAAEKLKGLTAKEQQAEEARQKYEAKLPEVMQSLIDVNNRDYADIKSQADIDTLVRAMNQLAATDPVQAQQINAYLTGWQMHQQKMAAIRAEVDQANQSKTTKERTEWADFMAQENAKARELIPELADPVKGPELERRAAAHLTEKLGFSQDELNDMAAGKQKLGIYHHVFQVLLDRSLKLDDLENARAAVTAKVAPKTLPPVQRPGVSRPAGAGNTERLQNLESKLSNSGSEKDAFELLMARRTAASRRAS